MRTIEILCASHATEDVKKVAQAIGSVLPLQYRDLIVLERETLKGHYGNPIVLFKLRIDNEVIVSSFIENLSQRMDDEDKKYLSVNLGDHVDESGCLYLRFDKQSAFLGKLKLGREDPIRVRVMLDLRGRSAEEVCRELGLIL